MPSKTFYPDADPETKSVDGLVGHQITASGGGTWAALIASPGNVSYDSVATWGPVTWRADTTTDKWDMLYRGVYLFDTSSIPNNARIISAILSIYGVRKENPGSIANIKVNVYSAAPASNVALADGDFDSLGATPLSDTDIAYDDWSLTGYNDFILNAAGRAAISKTGITKLGIREVTYDVGGAIPTPWGSNERMYVYGYMAEQGGVYRPKLVVTYEGGSEHIAVSG